MNADNLILTSGTHRINIPDSQLAREVTELIRDTESEMLFSHSSRVYLWVRCSVSAMA